MQSALLHLQSVIYAFSLSLAARTVNIKNRPNSIAAAVNYKLMTDLTWCEITTDKQRKTLDAIIMSLLHYLAVSLRVCAILVFADVSFLNRKNEQDNPADARNKGN